MTFSNVSFHVPSQRESQNSSESELMNFVLDGADAPDSQIIQSMNPSSVLFLMIKADRTIIILKLRGLCYITKRIPYHSSLRLICKR